MRSSAISPRVRVAIRSQLLFASRRVPHLWTRFNTVYCDRWLIQLKFGGGLGTYVKLGRRPPAMGGRMVLHSHLGGLPEYTPGTIYSKIQRVGHEACCDVLGVQDPSFTVTGCNSHSCTRHSACDRQWTRSGLQFIGVIIKPRGIRCLRQKRRVSELGRYLVPHFLNLAMTRRTLNASNYTRILYEVAVQRLLRFGQLLGTPADRSAASAWITEFGRLMVSFPSLCRLICWLTASPGCRI